MNNEKSPVESLDDRNSVTNKSSTLINETISVIPSSIINTNSGSAVNASSSILLSATTTPTTSSTIAATVVAPTTAAAAIGASNISAINKYSSNTSGGVIAGGNNNSSSGAVTGVLLHGGETIEQHCRIVEDELQIVRDSEQRLKQQYADSQRRERILVRRLALKEQEIQDYTIQISELKTAQVPGPATLRSTLLDPAINILFQKLKSELLSTRARLEETQNELSAWKFTPDSNTGKRLMAKCRLLYQENEELGKMTSNGRLAKLEGDLALQKSFSEEVKKSQSELDDFLQELDEDVEGMQSTILFLQQELKVSKDTITKLEHEVHLLKNNDGNDMNNDGTIKVENKMNTTSTTNIVNAINATTTPNITLKNDQENGNNMDIDHQNHPKQPHQYHHHHLHQHHQQNNRQNNSLVNGEATSNIVSTTQSSSSSPALAASSSAASSLINKIHINGMVDPALTNCSVILRVDKDVSSKLINLSSGNNSNNNNSNNNNSGGERVNNKIVINNTQQKKLNVEPPSTRALRITRRTKVVANATANNVTTNTAIATTTIINTVTSTIGDELRTKKSNKFEDDDASNENIVSVSDGNISRINKRKNIDDNVDDDVDDDDAVGGGDVGVYQDGEDDDIDGVSSECSNDDWNGGGNGKTVGDSISSTITTIGSTTNSSTATINTVTTNTSTGNTAGNTSKPVISTKINRLNSNHNNLNNSNSTNNNACVSSNSGNSISSSCSSKPPPVKKIRRASVLSLDVDEDDSQIDVDFERTTVQPQISTTGAQPSSLIASASATTTDTPTSLQSTTVISGAGGNGSNNVNDSNGTKIAATVGGGVRE